MSHAKAVSDSRKALVNYQDLRAELVLTALTTSCDGYNIDALRDKTPWSHGGGANMPSQNMLEQMESYVTTALMATHPRLSAAEELQMNQRRLASSLADMIPNRNFQYTGQKALDFGEALAASIAENVKGILAEKGIPVIEEEVRAAGQRSASEQSFIERCTGQPPYREL